jgi:hypothetical protein
MIGTVQQPYSGAQVSVVIGNVIVSGFTDGDFVSASYDEDIVNAKSGADGEVGISENPSRMGTIEITLMGTSAANRELGELFNMGIMRRGFRTVPVRVIDLSGTAVIEASTAWLKTAPDFTRGKEIGDTVWTIQAADLAMTF